MPSSNKQHTSEFTSGWQPSVLTNGTSHNPIEKKSTTKPITLLNHDPFVLLGAADWPSASLNEQGRAPKSNVSIALMDDKQIKPWDPEDIETIGVGYRLDEVISGFHLPQTGRMGEARMNATQIVSSAESYAQELIASAETQAKEIIKAAQVQMEEQYRQGYAGGMDASRAETEAMLQAIQAIVEEVQAWKISMLDQGEMMMLRLVIEIAQTIFGDGLPLDPDSLGQTFSRVLAEAKTLGDLRVYVHPDDATAISPHWSKMQTAFGGQKIELAPSEIIKRGGCFIDGQFGSVDARVETQLEIAKETLLSTLKRKNGSNS